MVTMIYLAIKRLAGANIVILFSLHALYISVILHTALIHSILLVTYSTESTPTSLYQHS